MKTAVLTTSLVLSLAYAYPSVETRQYPTNQNVWIPGGPTDDRGPCPMMNTLANHGFLPRNGRNLTRHNVVTGLMTGLNFNDTIANIMWEQAVPINPTPNATFFTLDQLNVHNKLEHDASLSRLDAYFGNNHVFNQEVFDTTYEFWKEDILDADQLANGKVFRQIISKAENPNYTFGAMVENFSLGELAAPILIFGNIEAGTVRRDLVKYFFENERLPIELGWKKQASPIRLEQVLMTSQRIADAAVLITDAGTTSAHKRRRSEQLIDITKRSDLHFPGLAL